MTIIIFFMILNVVESKLLTSREVICARFEIVASRAIHSQATQDDADYEVITAYVMEDGNSVGQEHELHSGPASIKVHFKFYVFGCIGFGNE